MNVSAPFIHRPIATSLLGVAVLLGGILGYSWLSVSALPQVDFPTIQVTTQLPGANPDTVTALLTAPLERQFGQIPALSSMTSSSSFGISQITLQFDLNRDIDGAAQDVQAAINAAGSTLPRNLPYPPVYSKVNPADAPIITVALTSDTISIRDMSNLADTLIAQRLAEVSGVGHVSVQGGVRPAVRIQADLSRLAAYGLGLEDLRLAIVGANVAGAKGSLDGAHQSYTIAANDQIIAAEAYKNVVVAYKNNAPVMLKDVANVIDGLENEKVAGWYQGKPAVIIDIQRQPGANVIETVRRVRAEFPRLERSMQKGIKLTVVNDRTDTIRASVHDVQFTLVLSVVLVVLVVLLFLRTIRATIIAGVALPLSLIATFGVMWFCGFSLDNLSLMALTIGTGFVVDDAIVMIENCFRNLEMGKRPLRATYEGARQIGFTVVSISVSLTAAFIPLLLMGGIVGRLFREFSVTLVFAIMVSTVVSLSVTPMICAYFVRHGPSPDATRFDRIVEAVLGWLLRHYERSLAVVINYRTLTLFVVAATVALTALLYIKIPKGFIPRDDTGLVYGSIQASTDVSFKVMSGFQQQALDLVLADPAVAGVGSSIGTSSRNPSVNRGRMYISLKPLEERGYLTTEAVIDRMRKRLNTIPGLQTFMFPASDVRVGGRQSQSQYQFTIWDPDFDELQEWLPRIQKAVSGVPGLVDVNTDRQQGGLQANVVIDRIAAARLNVPIQNIDDALNNAFSQRQISKIYTQRNQYQVILEVSPQFQRDPSDLDQIYAASTNGAQVPLSALAHFERSLSPLVINHQGQFPAVTISYDLAPGTSIEQASDAILQAVAELHIPDTLHAEFAGDAQAAARTLSAQPLLILAALIAVYIVLGVLYESLAHPLTIISTLPSAGLGALLALMVSGTELSIIAFIGIILLIGIVKKNGIMLVDFALEGERKRGLAPEQAIFAACMERFRPIMMTTMAALLGAIPLVIASGPGSELRRPLGITIIGGLIVSQVLTLYTTPVIYLLLDRLHRRLGGAGQIQKRKPRTGPLAPKPAP